jgi:hypothetical protein
MASLKVQTSKLNPTQLVELADVVHPKLAPAAPATPPIPNMATKAASLKTKRDAAAAANLAYESAKAALVNLKQARDATADDLRAEHVSVAAAVESEAKGDAVMLTASGYPLAADPVQTTTPPAQVQNLNVTAGDDDGELDATWDPTTLAKSYEVQTAAAPAGPWTTAAQPTASRASLPGLTSGQRGWVRVRAIGSKGPGAWSDVASKMVP